MAAAPGVRVWFRLEGAASADRVDLPPGADVADLRDKIKERLKPKVDHVAAVDLTLFTADGRAYDDSEARVPTVHDVAARALRVSIPAAVAPGPVAAAPAQGAGVALCDITASSPGLTGPALALEAGAHVALPAGLAGAGKTVLVREAYLRVRERLLAMRHGLACVYGTPGVGNSVFASLFVLSLAGAECESIFYTAFGSVSAQSAWCLRGGRVYEVPERHLARALGEADRHDRPSWLVVDGRACDTFVIEPTGSLRIVVVSSANLNKLKWLHEVDKLATLRLLMPPFSCAELECIPLARGDVRERFAQFGGSARLVLGDEAHQDWARKHVLGLGADVLRQVMSDVEEGSRTERTSSRILHLFPDHTLEQREPQQALEYRHRITGYASPAVADALVTRYWTDAKQNVVARLEAADLFNNPFDVSLLFEPVMHYRLRHGSAFDSDEGTRAFRLPALRLQVLDETYGAASLCPNMTYLQPASKNYAAIDAVAKLDNRLYLFQMTRQKAHSISMNGMLRVFDVALGSPGAVTYRAPIKKRTRGDDEATSEERAVWVPEGTTFVFVLTRARGDAFQVPQPYGRVDRILAPEAMSAAERHIRDRVRQIKVWAQYAD